MANIFKHRLSLKIMFLFFITALGIEEESQCFEMNQEILGLQATQELQVILKPKKFDTLSSFCTSLTGQSSYLQLNFLNIQSDLIPSSANTTINMSENQIVYTIKLVAKNQMTAAQIYQNIASQTEAMYNITFLGNIVLIGTIYTMNFHNLDATNCWSSGVIEYYFNTQHAFIQINVEPNDCPIDKKVEVQLHYKSELEENWKAILIPPYKLFILNSSYYNSDTNYMHSKVKHFRVTLLSYTGKDALLQMQKLLNMVVEFQKDRSFQFRLVLFTEDNGLKQEYYYDITDWSGVNETCFTRQKVYMQPDALVVDIRGASDECMAKLNKSEYLKLTLYVNDTSDVTFFQQIEYTTPDYFVYSQIMHIPLEKQWPLNNTVLSYYVYLTFCKTPAAPVFGQNVVFIDELVYKGTVQKSCITQMNLILDSNQICVNFYVNSMRSNITLQNGKVVTVDLCVKHLESYTQDSFFVMEYETKHLLINTRKYTMYAQQMLPKQIGETNQFCFKEVTVPAYKDNITGSLEKRALEQVKELDKLGSNLSYAYFLNDQDCYIIDTITVNLPIRNYMWIILVAIISIGIAGLFVFFQVKTP